MPAKHSAASTSDEAFFHGLGQKRPYRDAA
jgi:hypothetical protein